MGDCALSLRLFILILRLSWEYLLYSTRCKFCVPIYVWPCGMLMCTSSDNICALCRILRGIVALEINTVICDCIAKKIPLVLFLSSLGNLSDPVILAYNCEPKACSLLKK